VTVFALTNSNGYVVVIDMNNELFATNAVSVPGW
jgi:hypothetical protein